jgi:hypothetical protein
VILSETISERQEHVALDRIFSVHPAQQGGAFLERAQWHRGKLLEKLSDGVCHCESPR